MRDIYIVEKILDLYKRCHIHSFPVDCTDILKQLNCRVYSYSYLKEHHPALYSYCSRYSDDGLKYKDVVIYNDNHAKSRIRFTLAHEIGHIILGHTALSPHCEQQANAFAANLLAPLPLIYYYHCQSASDISQKFGLSAPAADIAWSDYLKWKHSSHFDADIQLIYYIKDYDNYINNKKPDKKNHVKLILDSDTNI